MNGSVVETVLVCLMLVRLASPTAAREGIIQGVSLVGGSGPHEGTVQLVVSDDGSQPPLVTWPVVHVNDVDATAICMTLGYPGMNRYFYYESPYLAHDIAELSIELQSHGDTTLIGRTVEIHNHRSAVRCQTDGYLGCFIDFESVRPLANSTCPPSPNSDYSCIDRDNMTTESCLEYCRTLNGRDVTITYAGVRAGIECTCGFNTTELGDQYGDYYCDSPCSGDRNYSNCGGTYSIAAFNITSEPDEQEYTTHALHPSPDPTNTTTTAGNTTTSVEADGDSCFCRSHGNAAHNAGIGVGVGVVLLAVLAMINVYICARTRKQAAKNEMDPMAKLTTTATAATSTPSDKHDVYHPLTTRPTSDCYTGLDVPPQDQGNSYENSITPGGAHSGVSVMAMETQVEIPIETSRNQ